MVGVPATEIASGLRTQKVIAIPREKRTVLGSARVTRAGDRVFAIANFLCGFFPNIASQISRKVRLGATPKPAPVTRALPRAHGRAQIDGVSLVCNGGNLL